jgi:DNA-binding response OmpR family regulator
MSKILVIEDEVNVQRFLKANLNASGYHVYIADDGEKGLQLVQSQHHDLIFLDLRLPGISGWDVLVRLKSEEEFAGIPVIVMTASIHGNGEERALAMGAADYITKPFTVDKLLTVVRKYLGE